MKREGILSEVSSKYIILEIFSHLDFNHAIKLIKYNNLLKNKIGLKKEEFLFTYKYNIRKVKEKPLGFAFDDELIDVLIIYLVIKFLIYIFILIESIETFKSEESKEDIKIIIISVFLLCLIPYWFLSFSLLCCYRNNCKKNCFGIMILINTINIISIILPILKLIFILNDSIEIKTTVLVADFAILLFSPYYIVFYFLIIYYYNKSDRG